MVANDGFPVDVAIASGQRSHLYHDPGSHPPHWDSFRRLQKGDMIHVDLWGPVGGYFTDFARSTVVGGHPTAAQRAILEAPLQAITEILAAVRPGVQVGEVFSTGERWMKLNGWLDPSLSLADAPAEAGPLFEHAPHFGHGIGMSTEKPWIVSGNPTLLEKNMVLAIEFIVSRGNEGAYLEHDLLLTDDGYEVLDSPCPDQWWT